MRVSMLLGALAAALLPAFVHAQAQTVPLPSDDPFYTQPANISSYSPGQIVRTRTLPAQISGFLGDGTTESLQAAYQYMFRTTDSLGNAVAAVSMLLVPHNADPTKLLAYETAYDSANNNCAPSYGLRNGANTTATTDVVFIAAALDKGWYVSTADYEGLDGQYVAGILAGHATLDSIRATFNEAANSGLSPKARYAMWGYSGGSLASEWAAELQASYAPELSFEGAALGGLVPNITSIVLTIDNGPFAGLAFAGILGLAKAYPNLSNYVDAHLLPSKRTQFEEIGNGCEGQDAEQGAFMNVTSYFDDGLATLFNPIPESILATVQMGNHGVPQMPLFVYKADGDEISPVADTTELVNLYCSKGVTIEYQKNLVGEHVSEAILGSGAAFAWVADRLDGVPVANPGKCTTESVAVSTITAETASAFSVEAIAFLQTLLGGSLGLPVSG